MRSFVVVDPGPPGSTGTNGKDQAISHPPDFALSGVSQD
jgi:hypothetical protein